MTYKKIRGLPKDSAVFKVCDQSCTPLKHAKSNCYSHTSKPLSCFVIFSQGREGNNLYLHLLFFGGAPVTGQRSHYAHVSFGEWVSFPRMLWMYGGASYRGVDGSQPSDHQKITFQYQWWVIQDAEELGAPRCTILILVRTDCRFFFFKHPKSLPLSCRDFFSPEETATQKTFFSNSFLPLSHPPIFLSCYLMEARGAFQILAQIISLFKLFSICLSNSEWNSMPHSAWLQAITRSSSVTM